MCRPLGERHRPGVPNAATRQPRRHRGRHVRPDVRGCLEQARNDEAAILVPWTALAETLQGSRKRVVQYAFSRLELAPILQQDYRDACGAERPPAWEGTPSTRWWPRWLVGSRGQS